MKASLLTPDSVPSLSALSSASTETGDNLSRVLFGSPKSNDKTERATQQCEASPCASSDASTRSLPTSSNASVSSEGTITCEKKSTDKPASSERTPTSNHPLRSLFSPSPSSDPSPSKEEDIPIQRSCHGGLNLSPKELANIFAMFRDSNQKWPPKSEPETSPCRQSSPGSVADSGTDAVTTVTSNIGPARSWERKVDSLERECVTLKEIIKADAVNMVGLKSQIKSLRTDTSAVSPEIEKIKSELAEVKRERDLFMERDAQHVETIKILKDEVNTLSKLHFDSNSKDKEISQLRLENQLFAAQIIENESEIQEMRKLIEAMQKEMKDRSHDEQCNSEVAIHEPALDRSRDSNSATDMPDGKQSDSRDSRDPLEQLVAALSVRLEAIERDRQSNDCTMPLTPMKEDLSLHKEVEGEGFEVAPDGQVVGACENTPVPVQEKKQIEIEKETRSIFCGCLLASRAIEE